MERFHVGHWNASFGVYGNDTLIAARLDTIRAAIAVLPGAQFHTELYAGDADPATVRPPHRAQLGIPSLDMVRVAEWRGGTPAHSDISLVLPPTGRAAVAAMHIIREEVEHAGFDYAGGFTLCPRHAIALGLVAFDRSEAAHAAAVHELFPRVIERGASIGAAPYRSHTAFMDVVAAQYGTADEGARRLTRRIKDALDPAGILAPGKQGIWPTSGHGEKPIMDTVGRTDLIARAGDGAGLVETSGLGFYLRCGAVDLQASLSP